MNHMLTDVNTKRLHFAHKSIPLARMSHVTVSPTFVQWVCSYSQFVKMVGQRVDAGGLRTFRGLIIVFLLAQPYLTHFCVEPYAAGVKATRVSAHLLQTAPRWPALWPWPSHPCLSGNWPWAGRTHGWLVCALFLQFLLYRQMIARKTVYYIRIYTFLEFLYWIMS